MPKCFNEFNGFFKNKTVFLTGHTGFKGSWLSLWLNQLGANVVGYALEPPTNPSLYNKLCLNNLISNYLGDIRSFELLNNAIQSCQPEIVFHLAAQSLVCPSYVYPLETLETNIMGTANVLQSVRSCPSVKVCVILTSDKCYANQEWQYAYRENDALGGHDPYSASKGAAEIIVSCFKQSFFANKDFSNRISLASVRAGNVIGGGDWAEYRLIPDCIRAIINKKPIYIRNPEAIRPWQHVLEPLSGYLWLAERMWHQPEKYSGPWNFGPTASNTISVRELVDLVIKYWGKGEWYHTEPGGQAMHEANLLRLDCSKANSLLQWYPVYEIEDSIKETVEWYKRAEEIDTDLFNYSVDQIARYVGAAKLKNLKWACRN
jgi:CDP-glucose 4,6-dehydratase